MERNQPVAVVTGGSSGIGRAIVDELLAAGTRVIAGYYDDGKGHHSTTRTFQEALDRESVVLLEGDVSAPNTTESWAQEAVARWGHLDIWVNNAAIQSLAHSEDMSSQDWHRLLEVNLDGYFWGCQAAAHVFLPQRRGSIINITSGNDILAVKHMAAYTAAKGDIVALTKTLAVEWGPQGIRVNSVAPGPTDTPINQALYTPEIRARYAERIPLGRIAHPADIASAVMFLASDGSRYITGHELVVDGGFTINGTVYHPLDE